MALKRDKIEHQFGPAKAGVHKDMKRQRNKKIRRTKKTEVPNMKEYKDYEF